MLDDEKEEFQENEIGAGQPDDYDKRRAAYKKELTEAVSSVRPGSSIGYLIAELRKKYGLNVPEEGGVVDQPSSQGNWSLAKINKSRDERMAKEAEENLEKQKKAKEVQQLKELRSRLYRARFQMPRGFSWPESEKEILRPFEFALDWEIWACFSLLKVLLRESLAYEFNLPGIEVNLIRFTQDARFHPGGEKQLLSEALSALKALLRIMKTKPETEKPALKAEKPVVKAQPKAKDLVLPANKKAGRQLVKLRPALPETSAKPMTAAKSEFKSFLWTNKFRRVFGLKPPPFNVELEKAFFRLSSQYQRAIVFRFRIAQPAISLKELMVGGLKRGVEELVKKAMEDLRQNVLDVRREEGIFIKPSASVEPKPESFQPEPVLPTQLEEVREPQVLSAEEPEVKTEGAVSLPEQKPAPPAPKTTVCRRGIKISAAKLKISSAQIGNYLVLLGLRFLSLSSEPDETPEVKIERPAISEEFGLEKPVGATPVKEQDADLPLRGSSHAVRLLKSPVFRDDLGLSILPERLREILPELDKIPYFKKNKLRPVKILEMRYLGGGNGGSPLSKGKIGKILGDYTHPTVNDWLNRIFLTIRELAAEGKIKE